MTLFLFFFGVLLRSVSYFGSVSSKLTLRRSREKEKKEKHYINIMNLLVETELKGPSLGSLGPAYSFGCGHLFECRVGVSGLPLARHVAIQR
jgi:hypothetical protein